MTPEAVLLFCQEPGGLVLAVSRKRDSTKFTFPGGKVEEGESLLTAIVREVKEETGWLLTKAPEHVYMSTDSSGYVVHVFETRLVPPIPKEGLVGPEGLLVRWVTIETLIKSSPFGDFNARFFNAIKS